MPPPATVAAARRAEEAEEPARGPRRARTLGWLGLLVLAEALALISTAFWQPRPLGLALGLALCAALGYAWWRAGRLLATVEGDWLVPHHPHAFDEVALGARLADPRGAPPLTLEAWSPGSRRYEEAVRLVGLSPLALRPTWTVRFPRRGLLRLPHLRVATTQPFGFWRTERLIGLEAEVLVLPPLGRVRKQLRARLNHWLETHAATTEAGDEEIARLRDYRPGDHLHRIHWRASAHHRKLVVSERHAPGCRRLALVLDTAVTPDGRRFERLISIAATLIDHFFELGWTVSLHGSFAPAGLHGERAALMEALALAQSVPGNLAEWIPHGRPSVVLALAPFNPPDMRPAPLVLTLAQLEELVHVPRRLR